MPLRGWARGTPPGVPRVRPSGAGRSGPDPLAAGF